VRARLGSSVAAGAAKVSSPHDGQETHDPHRESRHDRHGYHGIRYPGLHPGVSPFRFLDWSRCPTRARSRRPEGGPPRAAVRVASDPGCPPHTAQRTRLTLRLLGTQGNIGPLTGRGHHSCPGRYPSFFHDVKQQTASAPNSGASRAWALSHWWTDSIEPWARVRPISG